jgi:glycosyltransferase involved in cell wall biosynthesis
MHLVSFVVTVYNKTPSLPHLAASLLAQTEPFERAFVFVDNGSTDNSVAVLEQLTQGAEHVRIHRQANAGPAAATNAGFLLARGDVIKPMDADDVLAPGAVAALLSALAETGAKWAYSPITQLQTYDPGEAPEAVIARLPTAPFPPLGCGRTA